jgi:hypothetical protein
MAPHARVPGGRHRPCLDCRRPVELPWAETSYNTVREVLTQYATFLARRIAKHQNSARCNNGPKIGSPQCLFRGLRTTNIQSGYFYGYTVQQIHGSYCRKNQ